MYLELYAKMMTDIIRLIADQYLYETQFPNLKK